MPIYSAKVNKTYQSANFIIAFSSIFPKLGVYALEILVVFHGFLPYSLIHGI